MIDGVWTKVLEVVVPSWTYYVSDRYSLEDQSRTHILDLLHGEVCVRWHARLLRLYINND